MSQQPVVHPSPHLSQGDLQLLNKDFPAGPAGPPNPNTSPHCNHLALCPVGGFFPFK